MFSEFEPNIKKEPGREKEPKIIAEILEDKHDRKVVELENRKMKIVNEFRETGDEKLLNDLDNILRKLNNEELEQVKERLRRGLISEEDYDRQEKDLGKKIEETVSRFTRRSTSIIVPVEEYNEIFKSVPEEIATEDKKGENK